MGRVIRLHEEPFSVFEKPDLVIIPIGSIERHGNHLPLGTDTIIAQAVSEMVAEKLAEKGKVVALLPPIWYGYTWSLRHMDGTVSVDPKVLASYIEEIVVTLANPRFSRILFINGHGGNKEVLEIAVKEALSRLGPGIRLGFVNWWDFLSKEDYEKLFGTLPMHACEIETSIMMALNEKYVDLEAVEGKVEPSKRKVLKAVGEVRRTFAFGYLGDPKRADKEKGKLLLERVAERLASKLIQELEGASSLEIE